MAETEESRKPSRYQAYFWTETVLKSMLEGEWFEYEMLTCHSHAPDDNARQIGRYFPAFGEAYEAWKTNYRDEGAIAQLKEEAGKILSELPTPTAHFDVCFALDDLEAENARLRELLEKSIRVEDAEFNGEHGCRFILGENHVVAEWRGDGIATDTIFTEEPRLVYFETTTPHIRCMRMALEIVHWPVICAMVSGPGDGELKTVHEQEILEATSERRQIIRYLREQALGHDCEWELNDLARTIERGEHIEEES